MEDTINAVKMQHPGYKIVQFSISLSEPLTLDEMEELDTELATTIINSKPTSLEEFMNNGGLFLNMS